jgi:hypothetical protein
MILAPLGARMGKYSHGLKHRFQPSNQFPGLSFVYKKTTQPKIPPVLVENFSAESD